jgi:hypothetical protein
MTSPEQADWSPASIAGLIGKGASGHIQDASAVDSTPLAIDGCTIPCKSTIGRAHGSVSSDCDRAANAKSCGIVGDGTVSHVKLAWAGETVVRDANGTAAARGVVEEGAILNVYDTASSRDCASFRGA